MLCGSNGGFMFRIDGEYNQATVMLDELEDEATRRQIENFLSNPAFEGPPIVIMPDTHAGAGAVIGFTMPLNDYVIPNVVGVDIGCGVMSVNLGPLRPDLKALDKFIRNEIPAGFRVRNKPVLADKSIVHYFFDEEIGFMEKDVPDAARRTGQKASYVSHSLGSLGGGNHFIELGKDSEGNYWLTVHSGSRNFGLKVADFYQKKARNKMGSGDKRYHSLEWLGMKEGGEDYLHDMEIAQKYAELNRRAMIIQMVEGFFKKKFHRLERVSSVHNYIDFGDRVIRKGAIRAYEHEKLVIPFNMEDGLLIGEGRSNPEWNYSAPHGAGRVLSRRQAKSTLSLEKAKKAMKAKNIYSTSLSAKTLDEVKEAYKDRNFIIDQIKSTVKIDRFVHPVYNFKAE